MRRVGSWGMTAALILGLGGTVVIAAEQDNEGKQPPKGWIASLFPEKPKPPVKVDKKSVESAPVRSDPAEPAGAERQRQEHAMLRRMEVCDRLRSVALQTNNDALMRQADELEMRATEIYRKKTATLPLPAEPVVKPVRREKQAHDESGSTGKSLNAASAPPQRPSLYETPARLGGSLAQREQAAINGTGMGRDRP